MRIDVTNNMVQVLWEDLTKEAKSEFIMGAAEYVVSHKSVGVETDYTKEYFGDIIMGAAFQTIGPIMPEE